MSVATTSPAGQHSSRRSSRCPRPGSSRGPGTSFNTIPPNDYSYWETINALVQQERSGLLHPHGLRHLRPQHATQPDILDNRTRPLTTVLDHE